MRHFKVKEWELRLKKVFDEIDIELEDHFGDRYPRHPARPAEGSTSNPEMDGLFNVGASYSAGFGSRFGPGYVVNIRISTLQIVPAELKRTIQLQVKTILEKKLPEAFPDKKLTVNIEQQHLRITGNLSFD